MIEGGRQRCLGLDVGDRRIGVAVSDELGIGAHGVEVIQRRDEAWDLARIRTLTEEYEVDRVVVGFPRMMNGSVGIQGEKVLRFVESLKEVLAVPVVLWDERLSTRTAEQVLTEAHVRGPRKKAVVDRVAAVIILQNYLDSGS